jgi:transposase InsO family protein
MNAAPVVIEGAHSLVWPRPDDKKAERFIQTSLREWAYGRPYACSDDRAKAIKPWTDVYNLARPHSGIKGLTPWQRVNNLLGNDT